ncbi:carbohydrate ABC transporter permease [Occultella glacieicola]|uniref:Carbohydrate ABC transporter permease n=1 Tax=Occultella glacieicola TaxID=2518684 RepID=A0ABY2E1Z9_9MICO|nr:carbohydrate ABC transporter permease [Occultella glacieicola]
MPEGVGRGATRAPLRVGRAVSYVVLTVGALLMVAPFLWQFLTSVKSLRESTVAPPVIWPSTWHWENYARIFDVLPVETMAVNSVLALILRVTGQVLVASLAAYCFARLRFPFQRALLTLFLATLMVPPQLFIIPQYEVIRDLGWLNTIQALAVPGIFSSFGMFILYQFMRALPVELDEAARLDGANPWQIYRRVILPLCLPALAAVVIMTSLFSWNDLLWPLVINTDPSRMTLPVGLATLQGAQGTDYPVLMAGSLLAILPMVVIFVLLQKQFIRGIAMSGSK